jgi:glutamyl-Q tRNA(Asp) synthetase
MITRFAPSPTGRLHLGHAYAAFVAHDLARANGGTFLLRIEDIDRSRCRPEWEAQIYDDLHWLGLVWPEPVLRQSDRSQAYAEALDRLWAQGLLYTCTCSRRDIAGALSAPQEGALPTGADGLIYPGTCRPQTPPTGPRPKEATLRLALPCIAPTTLSFVETGPAHTGLHHVTPQGVERTTGDPVLSRRDMATSYHLSVVLDDAVQGITHVTRGEDLFEATSIHVLLQHLLGLPIPTYHHHRLIRDENGKRLAKRDDARAIRLYRQEGATPQDIRRMVGL